MVRFDQFEGFDWNEGNRDKNWAKHKVSNQECEEVFSDPDKKIAPDHRHSTLEHRFLVLGKTKTGRILYLACTWRDKHIRIISARDINKRELHLYEKGS